LTEQLTYEHIGQHYQDGTGLNPLGSYYDLAAGIDAKVGESWEFRAARLKSDQPDRFDTRVMPDLEGTPYKTAWVFGRSILGREVNLTVKYTY